MFPNLSNLPLGKGIYLRNLPLCSARLESFLRRECARG